MDYHGIRPLHDHALVARRVLNRKISSYQLAGRVTTDLAGQIFREGNQITSRKPFTRNLFLRYPQGIVIRRAIRVC
jgi:hypothetical protein